MSEQPQHSPQHSPQHPLPTAAQLASLPADRIAVSQLIPLTWAEGPGPRVALWVQGCTLRCAGCCNAALQLFPAQDGALPTEWMTVEDLLARVNLARVQGITLLGGEPMAHAASLLPLARAFQQRGKSVMLFTGYTLEYLLREGSPAQLDLLDATDLLVDGPYLPRRHDTSRRWVGSSNQKVRALSPVYRAALLDGSLLRGRQTVELRLTPAGISINGWPAIPEAEATAALRSPRT